MKRIGDYILGKGKEDNDCYSDQYKRHSPIGEETINLVTKKRKKAQPKKAHAVQRKHMHNDDIDNDDSDVASMDEKGMDIHCKSNIEIPNVSFMYYICYITSD